MQAAKGKVELGTKLAYARHRNYRRVYNPKAAQLMPFPKPIDCIASSSISIPEKKDDLKNFPKPALHQGDTQLERDETASVGDLNDKNLDALLMSEPADLIDNHVGVNGYEINQSGEIIGQSGDTKVEIAAIDLAEINVTFHVDSAPTSSKDPNLLDNTCYEIVAPEDSQALVEDMAAQLIDKSLESIPYVT
ncbi:hypothetical protein LIER_32081 [Lithospermum erythrorhizon]|uniref:Uncharacterized protein n=1 Tax=Lithospermum erythrorhizon TaxID=34254 RepID=A0AAV3RUN0_LITER